jgi:hypothetical protein
MENAAIGALEDMGYEAHLSDLRTEHFNPVASGETSSAEGTLPI